MFVSLPCNLYTFYTHIDLCSCECRSAYSVEVQNVFSERQCLKRCSTLEWCVMFSYVLLEDHECILYSNFRPCSTCSNATQCISGCEGRPTYLKAVCPPPSPPPPSPPPPPPTPSPPPPTLPPPSLPPVSPGAGYITNLNITRAVSIDTSSVQQIVQLPDVQVGRQPLNSQQYNELLTEMNTATQTIVQSISSELSVTIRGDLCAQEGAQDLEFRITSSTEYVDGFPLLNTSVGTDVVTSTDRASFTSVVTCTGTTHTGRRRRRLLEQQGTDDCLNNSQFVTLFNTEVKFAPFNSLSKVVEAITSAINEASRLNTSVTTGVCEDEELTTTQEQVAVRFAPSPPPPSPPPLPPPSPPPPSPPPFMSCTLDFASYNYALASNKDFRSEPDNFLTIEFALMEYYAMRASLTDSNDDYWCDSAQNPALLCLDIGAPSTLGNSLNDSAVEDTHIYNNLLIYKVQETANASSTQLFGQVLPCHGRIVGDGVINIFDISTLLAYLFSDWKYKTLSPNPIEVYTVQGREGVTKRCNDGKTRYEYIQQYSEDLCVDSQPRGYTIPPLGQPQPGYRLLSARYPLMRMGLQVLEQELVFDAPVYMAFVKLSCGMDHCLDVSNFDDKTRFYFHGPSVAISRSLIGDTVSNLRIPFADGVTWIKIDYTLTKVYFSEGEEYEVIPRVKQPLSIVRNSRSTKRHLTETLVPRSWSTFTIPGSPARLHAVFSGSREREVYFSNEPFALDATPMQPQVRITRRCSGEECQRCAMVLTGLNNNVAMMNGTLELLQTPLIASCGFDIHVYSHNDDPLQSSLTLEYLILTDMAIYERPTWSHFSCVDRRVWTVMEVAPPPLPASPPPSAPPYRSTLLPIVAGIFFTVALFNCGLILYHCIPYPVCSAKRCGRCQRRSSLRHPFHHDKCPRCQWIEANIQKS